MKNILYTTVLFMTHKGQNQLLTLTKSEQSCYSCVQNNAHMFCPKLNDFTEGMCI